jgi:transcriptional regulator with XRE-family HTH domain
MLGIIMNNRKASGGFGVKFKGEKLRDLRDLKGLTMLDLEEITGISQSTISDIENGKKNPRAATVERLCKALDVGEHYFYLDGAVLPTDLFPDMPESVKRFIFSGNNVPYLVLTEEAKRRGISPEKLKQIIDLLSQE